jgi:hypothetical protein
MVNVKSIRTGMTLTVGEIVLSPTIKWFAIVVLLNINLIKIQAFAIPLTFAIKTNSEENNAIIKELNF